MLSQLLRRLVVLQPGEAPVLLASFATLLCTFSSYTILRPVRDALGITSGLETIPYLFWAVFVCMLLLQPVYGWLTSRFSRSLFLPWIYLFLLAAFWGLMADVFSREQAGRLFGFIWAGASSGGVIGPFIDRKLAVPV